ncbi:hypothetical protein R80B4_00944 [Fibrobacteres bacterium R8-0-B4]
MKSLLLSIRPKYWEMILSGEKTVELRKTAPSESIWRALFYVTGKGGGAVVGKASVRTVQSYLLDKPYEPDCVIEFSLRCGLSREEFDAYYAGSRRVVLIYLRYPVAFGSPKRLEEYGLVRPPQSWCYVEEEGATE